MSGKIRRTSLCGVLSTFEYFMYFVIKHRQNKSPSAVALGDGFLFRTYVLTSKASPNDWQIVIVVIIIGEAQLVWHIGGIIAQTIYLDRVFLQWTKVCKVDAILLVDDIKYQWGELV